MSCFGARKTSSATSGWVSGMRSAAGSSSRGRAVQHAHHVGERVGARDARDRLGGVLQALDRAQRLGRRGTRRRPRPGASRRAAPRPRAGGPPPRSRGAPARPRRRRRDSRCRSRCAGSATAAERRRERRSRPGSPPVRRRVKRGDRARARASMRAREPVARGRGRRRRPRAAAPARATAWNAVSVSSVSAAMPRLAKAPTSSTAGTFVFISATQPAIVVRPDTSTGTRRCSRQRERRLGRARRAARLLLVARERVDRRRRCPS